MRMHNGLCTWQLREIRLLLFSLLVQGGETQRGCTHTHKKSPRLASFNWSPACTEKYTCHKRTTRSRQQAKWHRHGRARAERDASDQMLADAPSCEHCLCNISWLFRLKPFEIFLGCLKFKIPCWAAFIDGDGPHGTIKEKGSHFVGTECGFAFSRRTCSRAWSPLFCHLFARQCHTA